MNACTAISDKELKKLGFKLSCSESDGAYLRFEAWQNNQGTEIIWRDCWYAGNKVISSLEEVEDFINENSK